MTDATTTASSSMDPRFWDQVSTWFRWLKITAYSVASLFVLVVCVQAADLYSAAHDVHPAVGVLAILLMIGASILVIVPAFRFLKVPRVIEPPAIPKKEDLRLHHVAAECRYLNRYLEACLRNDALAEQEDAIRSARESLAELIAKVRAAKGSETLVLAEELGAWVDSTMPGILADIDARAEKMIYQEALNVGLGTAVSPNGTLDAFVMLWRSVGLASKLAVLYYGRPGPLGTLAVVRDVCVATAAAAYLHNVTESLGNVLAKSLGSAGSVIAGPAVEGVTNGLVLIRIGYLTKERCRSFRRWDVEERRSAIGRAVNATQKVAVGLTTEILTKVGTTFGVVADAAISGVSSVASAAADGVASAAEGAKNLARGLGQKVGGLFRSGDAEEAEEAPERAAESSET